jgi:hypothetical protein
MPYDRPAARATVNASTCRGGVVGVHDPLELGVGFAGVVAEPDADPVQPLGGGVDDRRAPVVGEPVVAAQVECSANSSEAYRSLWMPR